MLNFESCTANSLFFRMDGSTPPADRVPLVNKFNSDPSFDLLLLTTSVGGLGLNLTGDRERTCTQSS